ncbi:MAG: hypothetical protein LEGION0398_MBIBDBAK_01410 [Legionellaceae bacterium]
MLHLVKLIEDLGKQAIGFRSLCDGAIDTTTASGELIFNSFSSRAQFERCLIQERTRGRLCGRKPIEANDPKILMAQNTHKNHSMPINAICSTLKISRATFYRYLQIAKNKNIPNSI